MAKILIVDDEEKITRVLQAYLEKEGYTVMVAFDGPSALKLAREESPHLIILDLMLPGFSGEEVCRNLRQEGFRVPIIMLTAKSALEEKVQGLALGADDYVTKPFSPQEIIARVKSILRRTSHEGAILADIFSIINGDLVIDTLAHKITWKEDVIELTPTEFKLLEIMSRHQGRVYSRSQLAEAIFDFSYEGYDRTIDAHVKNLRRKLKEAGIPPVLKTVYGVGYKIEE